jgi:hypothetical protein
MNPSFGKGGLGGFYVRLIPQLLRALHLAFLNSLPIFDFFNNLLSKLLKNQHTRIMRDDLLQML